MKKVKISKKVMKQMFTLSSEWNNTAFAVINPDGSISASVWNNRQYEEPKRESVAYVNGNKGWNITNENYHWEVTPLMLEQEIKSAVR